MDFNAGMGVFFLVLACGLGVLLAGILAGRRKPNTPPVRTLPVSGQELFHKKCMLEQKMAGVAGGQTGLFVLLDLIQNDSGGSAGLYRESYQNKQARLREYMGEYQAVLEQARALPEEERKRFAPPDEIAQYRRLLEETV